MSCEKNSRPTTPARSTSDTGSRRRHMLTGIAAIEDGSGAGLPGGPSIDQAIAQQVGGATKFRSIELGVQVVETPDGVVCRRRRSCSRSTIRRRRSPSSSRASAARAAHASTRLRSGCRSADRASSTTSSPTSPSCKSRLGAADGALLDTHLASIREVERSLAVAAPTITAGCVPPDLSNAPADKSQGQRGRPERRLHAASATRRWICSRRRSLAI